MAATGFTGKILPAMALFVKSGLRLINVAAVYDRRTFGSETSTPNRPAVIDRRYI
jgi:hypothetical protein